MNAGTWIAIFMPLFLMLFIFIPQAQAQHNAMLRNKYKVRAGREDRFVENQMIAQCLGKHCLISTGGMNGSFQGTVVEINDNWLKVEHKGVVDLINCDYIQSIRELPVKSKK